MTPVSNERVSEERKFDLWFFRDLSLEQRLKLFRLFGLAFEDAQTHAAQRLVLRHILKTLRSQSPEPSSSEPVAWEPVETMPQHGFGGPFLVYWPPEEIDRYTGWYGGWSVAWLEPSDDGWTFRAQSLHVRKDAITHWARLTAPTLSPTVSQTVEAQPIHPLPMPKYDFQGNEPTVSQPAAGVTGEVGELIAWLEDRAQPDSGLDYGDDSRGIAYATVHGYDAAFVAEHFHGKGAAHLAALLTAALSAQERG